MTALNILIIILSIYAYILVLQHNLHMFQLNTYKNDEHLSWIKKHLRQQWLLYFGLFFAVLRIFFPFLFIDIILILTLIMEILVFKALMRLNSKVPLKYTPRVKRLIFTDLILSGAFVAAVFFLKGFGSLGAALVIVVSFKIISVIIVNLINHPVEALINRHYINDAKRILREHPEMKTVGVTGSYGKTSVKYYLNTLLKTRYNVLMTPGNFNTPLGITRTIRERLKGGTDIFICEMGARRTGEIKEICDLFPPDHGIITAVGPQHLETFHSIENIKKTKFELADAVKAKGGMIFLNADNEYIREKEKEYPGAFLYSTMEEGEASYKASDIRLSDMGTSFTVTAPNGEREEFNTRLIGEHNVINVLGAIAVSNALGIPLKELKVPVRRIEPVEHRMEIKDQGNVTVIDDAYNSNPIGSKAAVETLSAFPGLRILITPGMVELGEEEEEYNRLFGTYAAKCCDHILLVGRKRAEPIKKGVLEGGFPEERCRVFDTFNDAYSFAMGIKSDEKKYILLENDLPDNY